jgi:hypothetical protein
MGVVGVAEEVVASWKKQTDFVRIQESALSAVHFQTMPSF